VKPRDAITQIARMISREIASGSGPSDDAMAVGTRLAGAGLTVEIARCLLAEAGRKRPDDRMVTAYGFLL